MYLKFLIGLALAIVVGALFTNNIGDGFFKFQKKGKATKMADTLRDISGIMQTYQTDQSGQISPFVIADQNDASAGDNKTTYGDLIAELNQDNLVRGDGSINIGNMLTGKSGVDEVFLIVESNAAIADNKGLVTDSMCDIFNEVMEVPTVEADLTAITSTFAGTAGNESIGSEYEITSANVDALLGNAAMVANGNTEGVCIKDTGANDNNTIIFFVQKA
jgi:hypothetical protein